MESKLKKVGFKEVWASILELSERQKETDKQLKETDKQLKETNKYLKEKFSELKDYIQETDKHLKEKFSELKDYVGGIGRNNGDVAETYFYETMSNTMKIGHIEFDFIEKNVKRKNRRQNIEGEYDIILTNSESIAIIETKYKFHPNDIDKVVDKKIPTFRKLFPDKKDYKLYIVIAGLCIPDETKKLAFKHGFWVLSQAGGTFNLEHGDIKTY